MQCHRGGPGPITRASGVELMTKLIELKHLVVL